MDYNVCHILPKYILSQKIVLFVILNPLTSLNRVSILKSSGKGENVRQHPPALSFFFPPKRESIPREGGLFPSGAEWGGGISWSTRPLPPRAVSGSRKAPTIRKKSLHTHTHKKSDFNSPRRKSSLACVKVSRYADPLGRTERGNYKVKKREREPGAIRRAPVPKAKLVLWGEGGTHQDFCLVPRFNQNWRIIPSLCPPSWK
jgi:hypothetical protein